MIEIDEREAIAALKRMREGPPIVMNIDRLSAWHLMQDLQLVLKHPDLPPDGLHAATARALEGFLRNSLCGVNPVLADLARAGMPGEDGAMVRVRGKEAAR
jgi:hypothetical protein